ncbi:homocysteine S-methyltransferase family protein [Veillonella sp. R32]|uniref:homocysteine S-methyltransferase family protein n=1 Tax=Veillonella sp. R32 TaxID=2021312 RepID=UPI00138A2380|nr:homocysteine S-methyltransferase family protein [Veillonella sp. R32]KAF1680705.1 methionine synthase [Veillonella sp. R32]
MYIFDGAMGTMLQQSGLVEGECPELFNVDHPEIVTGIHAAYLKNGSDIVTTNTFGACGLKLADYGLEHRVKEINTAAVRAAKAAIEAVKPEAKVAGSMGPTGQFIEPLGQISFDEVYATYYEQALALIEAGVDFIIIETIIDVQEMRAALLAARDARETLHKSKAEVTIICQFSFSEDGRTITGTPPEAAAIMVEATGADVVGINCSLGPEQLIPLVGRLASVTNLPISAQPNAGMPMLVGKETVFPLSPAEMGAYVPDLLDAGATFVGACCGSTPAHIAEIAKAAHNHSPKERTEVVPFTAFTSRTSFVKVGHTEKPIIIGERINPTGRKVLAKEIKEGSFAMVKRDALAQVAAGADVLDVNMGVPDVDVVATMKRAIMELTMLVDVPLSIDTLDPDAMEAGLKAYPGRPLINSVNAEPEQLERVLPLAKRYGAAVLCLPLGKGDLPATAEERVALAKEIVLAAYAVGLRSEDLLLDPLVLTLASGQDSAVQTLRTLAMYKETFGFPTVMGLSNVSFGLPQRPYLNSQFLTMALSHGLTAPILNPLNGTVKKAFIAGRTLLGFDPAAAEFIADYGHDEEVVPTGAVTAKQTEAVSFTSKDPLENIQHAVEQGEKELVIELVEKALAAGIDPLKITKQALSEAMNVVGDKFGSGKVFLPQVMLAAEAMQGAFQTIKRVLPESDGITRDTVIVATVKGDIHDLGKNIVAALLENNGYRVVDLGKDVDPAEIVAAVKREKATVVGICSLMTTTMPMIDVTIQAIRDAGLPSKVIVGGAVLTQEYADKAGADSYAKDGISAVNIVKRLLGDD